MTVDKYQKYNIMYPTKYISSTDCNRIVTRNENVFHLIFTILFLLEWFHLSFILWSSCPRAAKTQSQGPRVRHASRGVRKHVTIASQHRRARIRRRRSEETGDISPTSTDESSLNNTTLCECACVVVWFTADARSDDFFPRAAARRVYTVPTDEFPQNFIRMSGQSAANPLKKILEK